MRGPLLRALAAATADQHRRVESLLPTSWRDLSRAAYAEYLAVLAGFHLVLEDRIFQAHDWAARGLPDTSGRRRAPLLRNDLRTLNVDLPSVPGCEGLPDVSTFGRALGALYVLEGSALGGQILARELEQGSAGVPTTFVRGAGDATGERWTQFCQFAERQAVAHPDILAEAPLAARETFVSLAAWFGARLQ